MLGFKEIITDYPQINFTPKKKIIGHFRKKNFKNWFVRSFCGSAFLLLSVQNLSTDHIKDIFGADVMHF